MNWLGRMLCLVEWHKWAVKSALVWQCRSYGSGYWVCERCGKRLPR